jgi:hypothetical protein
VEPLISVRLDLVSQGHVPAPNLDVHEGRGRHPDLRGLLRKSEERPEPA